MQRARYLNFSGLGGTVGAQRPLLAVLFFTPLTASLALIGMSDGERDQFDEEVCAMMKELNNGMSTLRLQAPIVQREPTTLPRPSWSCSAT